MIVEQIWTGNAYRNFNYLIACPETGDALAIDPLDYEKCLSVAKKRGWTITQILNTHEHGDHTGGNKGVVAATGAMIIAHENAGPRIPNMGRGVGAGDIISVGKTVDLECLDTPGHTMSHICLLSKTDQPGLFRGIATMVVIRTTSMTRFRINWKSSTTTRRSIPDTTTWLITFNLRWTGNLIMQRQSSCLPR